MLRRSLLSLLLLFVSWSSAQAQAPIQKKKPNIVLIFCDDLGYADVGCFGAKKIKTPHIDRMAREGVQFTSFYVAQAVCSASRTALLTGKYSNRVGILGALNHSAKGGITPRDPTIAGILKGLGYATAIFGKWHLGHLPDHLPGKHGFDEYFGLPYSNDMWPKHPTAKFPDLPLFEGDKIIAHNPDQSQLTKWYTEKAVSFIERNQNRPFFLYLPHTMPHVPIFASEKFLGKSADGLYGDVIEEIDWSVGRILETLKKLGLDDNTLVIFTSDNGPWLSYGNHGGSAGRLREGKGTSWEGGVRVPFVARWPGHLPAGKTVHEPAMTIDMLPTITHLVGGKLPEGKFDGKDISPLLKAEPGAKCPHDAYFFYWGNALEAVRSGPWKLYFPHSYRSMVGATPGQDGKPGPYKEGKTGLELYHLENDLSETNNVADQHPDVVRRLQTLADRMRADLGDSLRKKN